VPHTSSTPARQPGLSVLVVDDDQDILDALSEILESEGYLVRRARNGLEALDQLDHGRGFPRLVLLDLMMPVMDGLEFSKKMRATQGAESIPIIVLSADRAVARRAREIGAAGHLAKPFELSDLLSAVKATIAS
jgi:two-component system chemotaxis response regulator CheY